MAVSIIGPKFYAWDRNGKPLAFGKVITYESGTLIPKNTYTSEDETALNTNPVILNGEGYAEIFLKGSYKIVVTDENDAEIWTGDPISSYPHNKEWYVGYDIRYISTTMFNISVNRVNEFKPLTRIRITHANGSHSYSVVKSASLVGRDTRVTLLDSVLRPESIKAEISLFDANLHILAGLLATAADVAAGTASKIVDAAILKQNLDNKANKSHRHSTADLPMANESEISAGTPQRLVDNSIFKREMDKKANINHKHNPEEVLTFANDSSMKASTAKHVVDALHYNRYMPKWFKVWSGSSTRARFAFPANYLEMTILVQLNADAPAIWPNWEYNVLNAPKEIWQTTKYPALTFVDFSESFSYNSIYAQLLGDGVQIFRRGGFAITGVIKSVYLLVADGYR